MHFHLNPLPNEPAGDRSLAADGQHGSTIQPSVWPALLASSPYPDASEETGPQGTDLLGCDEYTLYSFYPYVLLIFLVVLLYK